MIVWVASYPRSGNTLFRIVLDRMGLGPTYSIHNDKALKALNIDKEVGHEDLPEEGLDSLAKDSALHFVKTHELPGKDDYPTIYIVRDGRDAIVSYAHYLKNIDKKELSLGRIIAKLITGEIGGFGLWGDHIRKWRRKPGEFAIVRYEDLVRQPAKEVARVLRQVQVPENLVNEKISIPSFAELQNMNSEFFRAGQSGGWSNDMTKSLERQFWARHRMGMALAGYEQPTQKLPFAAETLPTAKAADFVREVESFDPIKEEICMPPYYGPNDKNDINFLLSLAKENDVKNVFEYGTAAGNTVANLCKYTEAKITTLNALEGDTTGKYRTYDFDENSIGKVYRKYGYSERVTQVFSDSMEFVPETVADEGYDLVIIDACHDFEYALSDFLSIYQLVNEKGYVLFHDCDPSMVGHLEGPWRACTHLRHAGFNIRHVENTWWGVWSPSEQERDIEPAYLSLLDYVVNSRLERNKVEYAKEKQIKNLRSEVARYRIFPEVRIINWLRRRLRKIFI